MYFQNQNVKMDNDLLFQFPLLCSNEEWKKTDNKRFPFHPILIQSKLSEPEITVTRKMNRYHNGRTGASL